MDFLFWVYFLNLVFVISHRLDAVYWHEWDIFRMPGGYRAFLLLHVPAVMLALYGFLSLWNETVIGVAISFLVASGGLFAAWVHGTRLRKGAREFRTPVSLFIMGGMGGFSFVQMVLTLVVLFRGKW